MFFHSRQVIFDLEGKLLMNKLKLQTSIFVLTAFLLGCNEFMIVGIISDLAQSFNGSLSLLGLLVTLFGIVYAGTTPVLTAWTNRWPRYHVLMWLMGIFCIGNTLTAMAPNLFWLFVSRVITAAVAGTIISLVLAFVSLLTPMEKRGMTVAAVFAGFSIATIIGVPVGTMISAAFSWRVSFGVISILSMLVWFLLAKILPRYSEQMAGNLNGQLSMFKDARIVWGIVVMIALTAAEYAFYTYIRPLIVKQLGFSVNQLSLLLGLIGIMFILGNLTAGQLIERYGTQKIGWVSGMVLVLLLMLTLTVKNSWSGLLNLGLLCFVLGIPGSMLQVMFLNTAERDFPMALNLASSLNPICTNIGVTIGSLTASIGIRYIKLAQIGWLGCGYALIGVLGSLSLLKALKRSKTKS